MKSVPFKPLVERNSTINDLIISPDNLSDEDFDLESSIETIENREETISFTQGKPENDITVFCADSTNKGPLVTSSQDSNKKFGMRYLKEKQPKYSPWKAQSSTPATLSHKSSAQKSTVKKYTLLSDTKQRAKRSSADHSEQKSTAMVDSIAKRSKHRGSYEGLEIPDKIGAISDKSKNEFYKALNEYKENLKVRHKRNPKSVGKSVTQKAQNPRESIKRAFQSDLVPVESLPESCNFESEIEENKVISVDVNKYSTCKKSSHANESTSKEFSEMDKVMFNTYDEYNEEDYTFETVEEIIVEENEIEGSTWSRRTGVKKNTSHEICDKILRNKQRRQQKLSKLERAMNYNYKGTAPEDQHPRFQKPRNYPYGAHKGVEAVEKVEKYEQKARERSKSRDRKIHANVRNFAESAAKQTLKRCSSNEVILTPSLKTQIFQHRMARPQSSGRERSNSTASQRRFKFSEFTEEVETKICEKPKTMKKQAFDKIYRRFMEEKFAQERKLDEQRRVQKLQEEARIQEIEKSRKKVGSRERVDSFISKVQSDIKNRMCKAERKRQKKCIEEENQLRSMFKPKTNITKEELLEIKKSLEIKQTADTRSKGGNFVTFDENAGFDPCEYDLGNVKEMERFKEIESNFDDLQKKKQQLERTSHELLYPQYTQSSSNSNNLRISKSKSSKTFNEGVTSDHGCTSVTTSNETYPTTGYKKAKNVAKMKHFSAAKSPVSTTLSHSNQFKTPKGRMVSNLHNAWVDYINQKQATPEQTTINLVTADFAQLE